MGCAPGARRRFEQERCGEDGVPQDADVGCRGRRADEARVAYRDRDERVRSFLDLAREVSADATMAEA
jgi:hypothetical protein